MPAENLHTAPAMAWGLWRIEENAAMLASQVYPHEEVPASITHEKKILEFLAGRVLIGKLLHAWGLPFQGLTKNEFGKPFARGINIHLSLSHSYPYVAAVIDRSREVGIDIEQPKEKLLKVAGRVLHPSEHDDAGDDVVKHCLYWSAKECLVKIHGKKDLVFSENLRIDPFSRQNGGELIGRIIVNTYERAIPLQYIVKDDFVVVLNKY